MSSTHVFLFCFVLMLFVFVFSRFSSCNRWFRLDYQPLFGKMSPHSSPECLSSGRIKDRTRETVEIEPTGGSTSSMMILLTEFQLVKASAFPY